MKIEKPKKDDLAVVMYTSGSTGNPKGVMLSHANIVSSIRTYPKYLGNNNHFQQEVYVGFLPLAHILELICELSCIYASVRIGYSSPLTLTDSSTGIIKGQRGDIAVLRPTIMATVPLILERISKVIQNKILQSDFITQALFKKAFEQKLDAFKNNRKTYLLDRLIFNKIKTTALGGRVKLLYCGGSLLNENVQHFTQVCLSPIYQAYALTETCAGGTAQRYFDTDTNVCGGLMQYSQIRLVNWEEGSYYNEDKPNPRGEIHIGGDTVALGYYKLPELTKESFYYHNGVRYFATGDIGEMFPNGTLRIIDRKKDLVKLQGGEYVSLNKVEICLKLLPFVESCCVYANPLYTYCIVFVCPNMEKLQVVN
jgi:long-chain acyl-CoA synthetase